MERNTRRESMVGTEPFYSRVLIKCMGNRLIVFFSIALLLIFSPWVYSNPGYVNATELKGRVVRAGSGAGIPNATVQLFNPNNVGMDVTSTNKEGLYTIDLSVLEDKELANLESFILQAEEKGKSKKRAKLKGTLKLNGTVIWAKDIPL